MTPSSTTKMNRQQHETAAPHHAADGPGSAGACRTRSRQPRAPLEWKATRLDGDGRREIPMPSTEHKAKEANDGNT